MVNTLILINSPSDLGVISTDQLKSPESKVFSFNIYGHKILEKEGIKHEIAENYLSSEERLQLFDLVTSYRDWYNNKSIFNELEFEGVNLLSLLDTHEFQSFVMPELLNFLTIKRIIEKEKPNKIIATTSFSSIIKSLVNGKKIDIKIHANDSVKILHWDRITIKYNIGRFPISFSISRSKYVKIKNFLELTICSILGLWFDFRNSKKKTILMLEINPASYAELLTHINKYDRNIIFINRRRPAIWNLHSIKILRSCNGKLINFKNLLELKDRKLIQSAISQYSDRLEKLWSNEDLFTKLFYLEGYSFWPLIKDVLINTYRKRISEYILLVIIAKKIFERVNISCILSVNEIGETEKTILDINKNKISSILLEHGYSNYVPKTSRFDISSGYSNFRDKIAVWGNTQKNYLIEYRKTDPNRILVTGSPRHDSFFKRKFTPKTNIQKTILFAPHPITEFTGQADTNLHIKFEKLVRNLCSIIKKIPNVKIVVKLHPSQVEHNNDIRELFKEIDPTIPVYLLNPIIEIIESCDVVLTISPEGFDPSTIILEALILDKPTMNIVLDGHFYEFQYVNDNAVLTLSDKSDLEKNLSDILFNQEFRNELINNGRKHVRNFLSNYGTASEHLASILDSY